MERIYVAHPYNNNENNKKELEMIIKHFTKRTGDRVYISAVHLFGFMYDSIDYIDGIQLCLNELSTCDQLILCPGWENSKGCLMEYAYAKAKDMKIRYLTAGEVLEIKEADQDEK